MYIRLLAILINGCSCHLHSVFPVKIWDIVLKYVVTGSFRIVTELSFMILLMLHNLHEVH